MLGRRNGLIGCRLILNASSLLGILRTQKVLGSVSEVLCASTKPMKIKMIAEKENNFGKTEQRYSSVNYCMPPLNE